MTLSEKVAYIKGLAEGLKLDVEKDEVKVINAIIDLLAEMADSTDSIEASVEEIGSQLDEVDYALADLEEDFDDFLDEMDNDYCDCDDCFDCDDDEDEEFYEVTCPSCGKEICVEEDILLCGEVECPECGEILEFDFSSLMEDDVCDCGCGCEHHNEIDDSEDLMS